MSRPLLVYLDSSDISNFSNPSQRTPELAEVERQLLIWLEQGKIEFRFSHVHVIEAAPTELQYVELASKRFSYIKRLCGYKCFISPINILESEVMALSQHHNSTGLVKTNDNGQWFPSIDQTDTFFDIQESYREEIASISDRKQRRIAERKFFDKNGNLNFNAKENIKKLAPVVAKEISAKYPINQSAMNVAYQHFLNTGSMKLFLDGALESLADMESIGDWYQRQWDLIIPNSSYLRNIGEDLKNSLAPIRDNYRNLNESLKQIGHTTKEADSFINKNFEKLLTTMPKDLAGKLASKLGFQLDNDPSWGLTPTLLTLTTLSVSVGKKIALNGQKPRVSDFGDIYHAAYLPYVDIFRADSSIASAIKVAKLPFKTQVASKLVDLPATIRQLL